MESHPGRLSRPKTLSFIHGSCSHASIDQQLEDLNTVTHCPRRPPAHTRLHKLARTKPVVRAELVAEGRVTTLRYANKGNGQTLAVARNYETAIKSISGRKLTWHESYEGKQIFFVDQGGRRTWVVLENSYASSYKLTFIEQKAMAQVVIAGQLADAINKQGFATLYINFDNNSAVIKPEAKPAVDEIAALLANDKTLRLTIKGHTDNVGNASANKTLATGRAASVVKTLVQAGVDSKRLQSRGFGSEAPVADNRSKEGRAKNRRVELVKFK